jgi:hypothetical protein
MVLSSGKELISSIGRRNGSWRCAVAGTYGVSFRLLPRGRLGNVPTVLLRPRPYREADAASEASGSHKRGENDVEH